MIAALPSRVILQAVSCSHVLLSFNIGHCCIRSRLGTAHTKKCYFSDITQRTVSAHTSINHTYCCPFQVIGSPSESDIAFVGSDKARRYLRSLPPRPRTDFKQLWPDADDQVRLAWVPW